MMPTWNSRPELFSLQQWEQLANDAQLAVD